MILQALADFDRRQRATPGEAPAPEGFSKEKISFALVIGKDGRLLDAVDLRIPDEKSKKLVPGLRDVPQPVKRTSGVAANLFWDKTSYVLGLTAPDAKASEAERVKRAKRTAAEHAAFVEAHLKLLEDIEDEALSAFRQFLQTWQPDAEHEVIARNPDLLDGNLVFSIESSSGWLHERPTVLALLAGRGGAEEEGALCLVSGETAPIARLHPSI